MRVIGTCSICGGAVCVPHTWMSVNPPVPTCNSCGAVPKQSHGPIIEMEPTKTRGWTTTKIALKKTTKKK